MIYLCNMSFIILITFNNTRKYYNCNIIINIKINLKLIFEFYNKIYIILHF